MNHNQKQTLKEAFLSSLSLFLVIISGILFFFAIYKFDSILATIKSACSMLSPILWGIALAYLIHPITEIIENAFLFLWTKRADKKLKNKKMFRLPAILLTLVFVGGLVYLLVSMVVPELYSNITRIIYTLPKQLNRLRVDLAHMIAGNTFAENMLNNAYDSITEFVNGWVREDMFSQITVIISGVFGVVGAVSNVLIGCIVAIYLLMSKETFSRQFNLVLHAFFSDKVVAKIKEILRESDSIFGGFISGKILDSFIIGILFFLVASIIHLPYVVLVSVIIGVTNVIPFFGPYIGAIPSGILIFLDSPTKGLIFVVVIIIIQQFDGNILGPMILGDSTGLSPFWVIFSILVGSGMFGILGMIMGVPTFGVIYYLIKSYIHYRIHKKNEEAAQNSLASDNLADSTLKSVQVDTLEQLEEADRKEREMDEKEQ